MKEKECGSSKAWGVKVLPFYLFTFLLFALSGCIEEYEADFPTEDTDLLTVEGTICSEKVNRFILSRTQSLKSGNTIQLVTGALLSVRGSDGSEYPAQAADGYYACTTGALNPDVDYYLHIETDGEVYESEPQKPLRTEEIADVRGVQYTPENNIDILVTPEAPFESDKVNYYSWTYDETWEVRPDYTTIFYYDISSMGPVYDPNQFPERGWRDVRSTMTMVGGSQNYEGEHIQKLKIYDIDASNERIYYKYSALVHQRAISKAEYEYELARCQASSEMGGLFTPQPSFLPTNIHCLTSSKRAIGFVGCSLNMSEYRFFLSAKDFHIRRPVKSDTRLWVENPTHKACLQLLDDGRFLCVWEDERDIGGPLLTAWAYGYQLDVRYKGAYIEKPDFWEDEE